LDWDLKMSPLHYSVFFGHIGCIKALLDAGADKDNQLVYNDGSGDISYTLLALSVLTDQHPSAKLLLENGVSINHMDDKYETVLHKACRLLKLDLIILFVEWRDPQDPDNIIDINKFSQSFDTPLTCAIKSKYKDKKLQTPGSDPISPPQLEIIQYLLSKGAKVQYTEKDLPSDSDLQQLNYKISGGSNKKSQGLYTFHQPLCLAVKIVSLSLIKLLLHKGADINVLTQNNQDNQPQTPLDIIEYFLIEKVVNNYEWLNILKRNIPTDTHSIRFVERMMDIYEVERSTEPPDPSLTRRKPQKKKKEKHFITIV